MQSCRVRPPFSLFPCLFRYISQKEALLHFCGRVRRAGEAPGRPLLTAFSSYTGWHVRTLTFNELGSKGGGAAAEVDVGTFLQDEWVFLVKRVTT